MYVGRVFTKRHPAKCLSSSENFIIILISDTNDASDISEK